MCSFFIQNVIIVPNERETVLHYNGTSILIILRIDISLGGAYECGVFKEENFTHSDPTKAVVNVRFFTTNGKDFTRNVHNNT